MMHSENINQVGMYVTPNVNTLHSDLTIYLRGRKNHGFLMAPNGNLGDYFGVFYQFYGFYLSQCGLCLFSELNLNYITSTSLLIFTIE